MSDKKVYFNKPQRLTQLIGANTTVIVAGRRTGKTDSIAAPFVLRHDEKYLLINQASQVSNALCRSSTASTTKTLSLPFSQPE